MKFSIYQSAKNKEREAKAITLYKQGFNLKEVGSAVGRSNTWAWLVMKKYGINTSVDKSDK